MSDRTQLLVQVAGAFALGILLADYLPTGAAVAFAASFFLVLAVVCEIRRRHSFSHALLLLAFCLAGGGASLQAASEVQSPLQELVGSRITVEGIVSDEPDRRPDKTFYTLQTTALVHPVTGSEARGKILVLSPEAGYGYQDVLRVSGRLLLPQDTGNPGAFDYRKYLARKGIGLLLVVDREEDIVRLQRGEPGLQASAITLKNWLVNGLAASGLSPEQAAVVGGITLGERAGIPESLDDVFTITGVVHILSVSGLHVGFVLGLVLAAVRLLRLGPAPSLVFASMILAFYTLVVGAAPPVVRAGVMGIVLLAAHRLGYPRHWPSAMAAAALAILAVGPLSLFDPGFQLSFAATWGILFLGPGIVQGLAAIASRKGWPWRPAWGWVLAVPLAAQLATLPLTVLYYNQISAYSLPANLISVPLVGLIFVLGMVAALIGAALPALAWLVAPAVGFLTDLFVGSVRVISQLPGASIVAATPEPWQVGAAFIVLYLGGRTLVEPGWRERLLRVSWGRAAPIAAIAAFVLLVWMIPAGPRELEAHFIDVGQGDACLLRLPNEKTVLIDAGGWTGEFVDGDGAGHRVVVPYLKRLGVGQIDLLVLSHLHEDHAGGASAVASELDVAAVALPPAAADEDDAGPRLRTFLIERGIPAREVTAGDSVRLAPDVEIAFLAPTTLFRGTGADANNNSLVMLVRHGANEFLFTGDIEAEAQQRLINGRRSLAAEVLKMPHHGSYCEPRFVARVKPELAVISVGADNRFGHPKPETVALLEKAGVQVFCTDRDGAVVILSDGRHLRVRTGRAD